jgi:hypothetical protein
MKTTKQKLASVIVLFAALVMAQTALAFYNPSTGTWLSRDPIGEPGFQALQTTTAMPQVGGMISQSPSRWIKRDAAEQAGGLNTYNFNRNDPIQLIDLLGLDSGNPIDISVRVDEARSGFGYAGWSIRLRWTPPKDWTCCDRCTKVIWVQDVGWLLTTWAAGAPIWRTYHKDWDETDYPGNSDLWECNKHKRGDKNDNVEMWDDPEIAWLAFFSAAAMDFRAEARVKCIEGPDKGKIYGGVFWGYQYKAIGSPHLTGGVKVIW